MKNTGRLLVFAASLFFISCSLLFGQGTTGLNVVSMPNFPDLPADSAYEGQSYIFDVVVINNTNTTINNSTIEINLRADSIESVIATINQVSMNQGDTITIAVGGYNFTQGDYAAGNNIVVVWPRVSSPAMTFPTDTFFTNVFFIPLNSLGDDELIDNQSPFILFPNPSNTSINILNEQNLYIEYVRIYDVLGKLVFDNHGILNKPIDVSALKSGIYWLVPEVNGKSYYLRFVVD